MYKTYLNSPDTLLFTKSKKVFDFVMNFPELASFSLGVAKSVIQDSPVYKNYKDFLNDFIIEESVVDNGIITVFNDIIELPLQFKFYAEDFGHAEDYFNGDPENSSITWLDDVKFTSLELLNQIKDSTIKQELEAYFLAEFNKCEYTIGRINYLINPR